ncbi:MAG: hypothetical protein RXR03_08040 [Thermocladium sp.]|jgi:hypothetical protein
MESNDLMRELIRWYIKSRLVVYAAVLMSLIGAFLMGYAVTSPSSYVAEVMSQIKAFDESIAGMSFIAASMTRFASLLSTVWVAYIPIIGMWYAAYAMVNLGVVAAIPAIGYSGVASAMAIMISMFFPVAEGLILGLTLVLKVTKRSVPTRFIRYIATQYVVAIIISLVLLVLLSVGA